MTAVTECPRSLPLNFYLYWEAVSVNNIFKMKAQQKLDTHLIKLSRTGILSNKNITLMKCTSNFILKSLVKYMCLYNSKKKKKIIIIIIIKNNNDNNKKM